MKYKTTRKAITEDYSNIVSVGYCGLQSLLSVVEPIAYTSGVYGWNFDVYSVDGLTICTGYRGMPGRRANNANEYEKRAEKIRYDYNISWDDRQAALRALLSEFVAQA